MVKLKNYIPCLLTLCFVLAKTTDDTDPFCACFTGISTTQISNGKNAVCETCGKAIRRKNLVYNLAGDAGDEDKYEIITHRQKMIEPVTSKGDNVVVAELGAVYHSHSLTIDDVLAEGPLVLKPEIIDLTGDGDGDAAPSAAGGDSSGGAIGTEEEAARPGAFSASDSESGQGQDDRSSSASGSSQAEQDVEVLHLDARDSYQAATPVYESPEDAREDQTPKGPEETRESNHPPLPPVPAYNERSSAVSPAEGSHAEPVHVEYVQPTEVAEKSPAGSPRRSSSPSAASGRVQEQDLRERSERTREKPSPSSLPQVPVVEPDAKSRKTKSRRKRKIEKWEHGIRFRIKKAIRDLKKKKLYNGLNQSYRKQLEGFMDGIYRGDYKENEDDAKRIMKLLEDDIGQLCKSRKTGRARKRD